MLDHSSHVSYQLIKFSIFFVVFEGFIRDQESKMFIVSHLDGVKCLTSLTMEVFISPLYCFEQERQIFFC